MTSIAVPKSLSRLTLFADYCFTCGRPRLDRWRPDDDKPRNIIGLPRLLMTDDGERLYSDLCIDGPRDRVRLFGHRQLVRWAHHHCIIPAVSSELARAFFCDMRYRRRTLDGVAAAFSSKKSIQTSTRFSLEFNIIKNYFGAVATQFARYSLEEWEAVGHQLEADDGLSRCAQEFFTPETGISKIFVLVLMELRQLLQQWPSLTSPDRERTILGVFALMTMGGSFRSITWAIEQVPELVGEFAHLRPVYTRNGRRRRPPTQRQTIWTHRLWRRQIRSLRRQLSVLHSIPAEAAGASHLHQQSKVLDLIHKARLQHRRLQALAQG